jgi:HAMP domain-containing protein
MSILSIIGLILIASSAVMVFFCYIWVLRATSGMTALAKELKREITEYGQATHDAVNQIDQRVNEMNESITRVTDDLTKLSDKVKQIEEAATIAT